MTALVVSSPLFLANSSTEGDQRNQTAANLGDGRIVLAWIDSRADGNGYGVVARIFDEDGQPLTDEFVVNSYTLSDQVEPSIGVLSDGSFVIAWQSFGQDDYRVGHLGHFREEQYGVFAQRFDKNGDPDGEEHLVNSITVAGQSEPQVLSLDDGGYIITWRHSSSFREVDNVPDVPGLSQWGQQYDKDGNEVGEAFTFDDGLSEAIVTKDFFSVQFEILPDGNLVGLFRSSDGTLSVGQFDQSGNRIGELHEVGADVPGVHAAAYSSVAVLQDGGYVVAFQNNQASDPADYDKGIWYQRFYASGVPVGQPILVSEGGHALGSISDGYRFVYDVIGLSDGGFAVSWSSTSLTGRVIKVQLYYADGSERGEVMELSPPAFSGNPQEISLLEGDRILVTWSAGSGLDHGKNNSKDVFALIYEIPSKVDSSLFTENGDTVDLSEGLNAVDGLGGNDDIFGTDAKDTIFGGFGSDHLDGGEGDDLLKGDGGRDFLTGGGGNDVIEGGHSNDTLLGEAGSDQLSGGQGDDSLRGGGGDDVLLGDRGSNSIFGGYGDDMLFVSVNSSGERKRNGHWESESYAGFAAGGKGNDTIMGGFGSDTLTGGAGNDLIDGGKYGIDSLSGGSGNDELSSAPFMFGNSGNDTLHVTELRVTLNEYTPGIVDGGKGLDTLALADNRADGQQVFNVTVDLSSGKMFEEGGPRASEDPWTVVGIENVTAGGDVRLTFIGNDKANFVSFGYQSNTLSTGGGNDTVVSELADVKVTRRKDENVTYNTIETGLGDDSVLAGASDDAIYAGRGNDYVNAGWFNDIVDGGMGDDTIFGSGGKDLLSGSAGTDWIHGGRGKDTIAGGAGNDVLSGGAGEDVFVFRSGKLSGRDVITDFESGKDLLAFKGPAAYSDLTVSETEGGSLITWQNGSVHLDGISEIAISESDFVF